MKQKEIAPKHTRMLMALEERVRKSGRTVLTEHQYRKNGEHEADLLVIDHDHNCAFSFEIKTRGRAKGRKKARKQLISNLAYLGDRHGVEKVYSFFVYGVKKKNKYRIERWVL